MYKLCKDQIEFFKTKTSTTLEAKNTRIFPGIFY